MSILSVEFPNAISEAQFAKELSLFKEDVKAAKKDGQLDTSMFDSMIGLQTQELISPQRC